MATIQETRTVLQSLSREDRTTYINNFNALDSDEKRKIANDRLVERFSAPEPEVEPTTGIFGRVPISEFEKGERNILGRGFEVPAASAREAIRSKKGLGLLGPLAGAVAQTGVAGEEAKRAAEQGAVDPGISETFTEEAQRKSKESFAREAGSRTGILSPQLPGGKARLTFEAFQKQQGAFLKGTLQDFATNPASVLLSLIGQAPGVKQGLAALSKTRPIQALGRFGTKERHLPTRGLFQKAGRAVKRAKVDPLPPPKEVVAEQIKRVQTARAETLKTIKSQTDRKVLNSANRIDDEVLKMTDDLQRSAETGSLEFQKRIPKAQRAASNEYGRRLDSISDDLIRKNETITKGDMNNALNTTKQELRELQLPVGRAEAVIDDLANTKYGTTEFSKNFNLREIVNDTKLIKGQASSGVKLGTKPFSDDEVAIAIFNNNFGKLLEKKAPALIELNKSYSPVMRVNKAAHRLFKPRAGEFQTKAGTGILKKAATKKVVRGKISPAPTLERGERELIRILEEGTEFGKGVGKVSEPTRRIGERIAGREVAKVKAKEVITKAGKIKGEQAVKEFDRGLELLAKREKRIAQLVRNKEKVAKIRRLVIGGVFTTAAALGVIRGFFGIKRSISEAK